PEYLLVAMDARKDPNAVDRLAREKKLETLVVRRWMKSLAEWEKGKDPIFAPWFKFAALNKDSFAAGSASVASSVANDGAVNPLIAKAFAGAAPASLREVAERYGKVLSEIDTKWMEASKGGAKQLADAPQEALRQVFYAAEAPPNLIDKDQEELIDDVRPRLRELKAKIDELDATHPGAPPRGMALEEGQPHNVRVFIRGNPGNRGPEAPRQFLEILTPGKREPYKQGSGRLELAKAIASKDNPLTARVFVNRVWRLHFGNGLVRTPSDFGVRADPPTHPELLDYLASQFMQNGWSVKKLHKMIMMTSVYQQSSDEDPKLAKKYAETDSANFLLWRMNRHRLEFEALRDTLLKVAGQLDLTGGGLPVELTAEPTIPRRTVYGFIDRQNLPAMFRTFDFANPDSSSPQRFSTTVPQQALFLMNNSFLVEQARHFVTRKDVASITDEDKRIQRMYQVAYQRQASPDEMKLAKQFLAKAANAIQAEPEKPSWQHGYGRYDEATKRVTQFTLLPNLVKGVWQGGQKLPDTKLSFTSLSAAGGHTGNNPDNQVIRRWIAPQDGVVAITGTLSHGSNKGDGVRGRIVSSRSGELGQWVALNRKVETPVAKVEVKKGDTIDFVTDCRAETSFDSFGWAPKLNYTEVTGNAMAGGRKSWDAQADFDAVPAKKEKPLDAWEKYAQAILLSNELVFVD
ncbi:MAG TPA: DUF1553 domain-containing protein, partial [Roseimicrobium sp.]|nr:DUF1553 domain-containing protein [Roseimicrobium sp.]